ncbi:MAG: flavin reductase family protein [Gemmatimonadota bacterium]
MTPKRIGRHVGGGPEPEEERERRERTDALKDAFARWASGVSILAVRSGDGVHALTVSAFVPVSLEPPLVLASLGPNASALPYLEEETTFAVSMLTTAQQPLASRFADTLPVGPSPFPAEGPPVVADALASLVCEVDELLPRGDHTLVIGRVRTAATGPDAPALTYYRRDYHSIG